MPRVTITISSKQPQPYRFPLDRDDITLGRGSNNDISIQSESVSIHHAKMHRVPGGFELRDMGSTNGLKVEGEKKIFVPLRSGMTVRIGEADFFFQLSDEEQEELGKEVPADEALKESEETKELESPKKKEKKEKKSRSSDDESSDEPAQPERRPVVAPRSLQKSSGSSGGAIFIFLLLAAVAFFVGMSIRFQKETGKLLHEALLSRSEPAEAPAEKSAEKPAEAPESGE